MKKITKRIHEGKYIDLIEPTAKEDMTCLRCGKATGRTFNEGEGVSSWFCLGKDCIDIDFEHSKKIARKEALALLCKERADAEVEMSKRKSDGNSEKTKQHRTRDYWFNHI